MAPRLTVIGGRALRFEPMPNQSQRNGNQCPFVVIIWLHMTIVCTRENLDGRENLHSSGWIVKLTGHIGSEPDGLPRCASCESEKRWLEMIHGTWCYYLAKTSTDLSNRYQRPKYELWWTRWTTRTRTKVLHRFDIISLWLLVWTNLWNVYVYVSGKHSTNLQTVSNNGSVDELHTQSAIELYFQYLVVANNCTATLSRNPQNSLYASPYVHVWPSRINSRINCPYISKFPPCYVLRLGRRSVCGTKPHQFNIPMVTTIRKSIHQIL
jgi:hypothetical protein